MPCVVSWAVARSALATLLVASAVNAGCGSAGNLVAAQAGGGAPPAPSPQERRGADGAPADEGARPTFSQWLSRRGLDLLDVASLRVAVGPGLLAHARITRFVAAGAGLIGRAEAWSAGFEMGNYGLGWVGREGGLWRERRSEIGLSTFYYCESEAHTLAGNRETYPPDCRRTFDVGAELHLALVGVAAEVRPDQAFDFVAGILGFDPSGDD